MYSEFSVKKWEIHFLKTSDAKRNQCRFLALCCVEIIRDRPCMLESVTKSLPQGLSSPLDSFCPDKNMGHIGEFHVKCSNIPEA